MKHTLVKTIGGIVLAVSLLSLSAVVSVSGQNGGGNLAVGTCDVQVTIRNCQTGAEIRTFASITTCMQGGTLIDSTSGIPQALKTPGHGVWRHIRDNTYQFSIKSFNFDAAGNATGWTIVRHELNLGSGASESESSGTAEVYDANGNLVFTGCSTATSTRFE